MKMIDLNDHSVNANPVGPPHILSVESDDEYIPKLSGTFTTVYAAYNSLVMRREMGDWRDSIDLVPVIAAMRRQRHPWMVEGTAQYMFCYKTLLHLIRRHCQKHGVQIKVDK